MSRTLPREVIVFYLARVPSYSTDGFSAHVIERQALFLRLDVPDRDKTAAASRDCNMWYILVPVQTIEIIGASHGVAHAIGTINVIEVGDEKLQGG